jgi:hypothetical protein
MTDNVEETTTSISAQLEMGYELEAGQDAGGTNDDGGITLLDADVDHLLVAEPIGKLCQNVKSGGISLGALKAAAKRHKVPVHQSKPNLVVAIRTKLC